MPAAAKTEALAFTYEDYRHLPDDGKRYEIIEGDLFMSPSPSTRHQNISLAVAVKLFTFVKDHRLGRVLEAPYDVVLSEHDVLRPDLLFVSNAHLSRVKEENLQGAPDLIVEILSPATRERDTTVKRKLYARFGVQEYWIVDPEAETIEVLSLAAGVYKKQATFGKKDTLCSPLLQGLEIALREIF